MTYRGPEQYTALNKEQDPDRKLRFGFVLCGNDIRRLTLYVYKGLLLLPLTAIIFALIIIVLKLWDTSIIVMMLGASAICIAIMYIALDVIYRRYKRESFRMETDTRFFLEFLEEKLYFSQHNGKYMTEYRYADIVKAKEFRRVIYLFFNRSDAIIVKKESLSPGDLQTVREILRKNVRRSKLRKTKADKNQNNHQ